MYGTVLANLQNISEWNGQQHPRSDCGSVHGLLLLHLLPCPGAVRLPLSQEKHEDHLLHLVQPELHHTCVHHFQTRSDGQTDTQPLF